MLGSLKNKEKKLERMKRIHAALKSLPEDRKNHKEFNREVNVAVWQIERLIRMIEDGFGFHPGDRQI